MGDEINFDRRTFLEALGGMLTTLSIPDSVSAAEPDTEADPPSGIGRFGDIDENTTFEVCIIGSGFAGAILGESLARHGIKTVIVESGPEFSAPSSSYAIRAKAGTDKRFQELDKFRSSGPINYPVAGSHFRGIGGTSWIWGGVCTRLHPSDFQKNAYTPAGASWPITYAELEPYYQRAERALRVRGSKPTKYHPPAGSAYPHPSDRDCSPLVNLMGRAGVIMSETPYSSRVGHKIGIFNDGHGPFIRMADSHLPGFRSSSHATLVSEVTVTRLLVDPQGGISGVEIRSLDRDRKTLRARLYVVACGGVESPRLLLLSRSRQFPKGIGNNYDLVGRFFMEHRPAPYTAQVKLDWDTFSLYQLRGISYQFYEEFKKKGLGGMRLGFHLDGANKWSELYAGEIRKVARNLLTRPLSIVIETEPKPDPENRVTLDDELKDYFGQPAPNLFFSQSPDQAKTLEQARIIVREIYERLRAQDVEELPQGYGAHHHMGTCRMGDNPRNSVVDRNLQVHGVRNLFVAGSSVFVTSGTAHPTLNLTALTLRLADFLRTQLRDNAFPSPAELRRQASRRAAYESLS